MKKIRLLLLLCIFSLLPSFGQQLGLRYDPGHIPDTLSGQQKEQALFVYGFYSAYMSGVIYPEDIDIAELLFRTYVARKVRKEQTRIGASVLLKAQDCVEWNLKTLYVAPMGVKTKRTTGERVRIGLSY